MAEINTKPSTASSNLQTALLLAPAVLRIPRQRPNGVLSYDEG